MKEDFKIRYGAQHNCKGKYHLIPINVDGDELCESFGTFLFSHTSEFEIIDGKLYEFDAWSPGKRLVDECQLEIEFCKKCIKKAIKNEYLEIHKG